MHDYWKFVSWFLDSHLLAVTWHPEEETEFFEFLLLGSNLIHDDSTLMTSSPMKGPTTFIITWGLVFLHMNFETTQTVHNQWFLENEREFPYEQWFNFCVYIQKKWKQGLIFIYPYSSSIIILNHQKVEVIQVTQVHRQMNKQNMTWIYTMGYNSSFKRKEILIHAIIWMKLRMLSEVASHKKTYYMIIPIWGSFKVLRVIKLIETENRILVDRV